MLEPLFQLSLLMWRWKTWNLCS